MDGRDWVDGYPRTARNVAAEELLADLAALDASTGLWFDNAENS